MEASTSLDEDGLIAAKAERRRRRARFGIDASCIVLLHSWKACRRRDAQMGYIRHETEKHWQCSTGLATRQRLWDRRGAMDIHLKL
jgi:hypothetical protein